MKPLLGMCLLVASISAFAAEDATDSPTQPIVLAGTPAPTSHALLTQLQVFLHQRDVDPDTLTADAAVRLMIDWFRFTPVGMADNASASDALVFRYGGWSEGCATAFNLSLLRRVKVNDAGGDGQDQVAGITLMFEPSGNAEILPFTTASSDWKSIDAFLQAMEDSPAFKQLATATPMGVLMEGGGLR